MVLSSSAPDPKAPAWLKRVLRLLDLAETQVLLALYGPTPLVLRTLLKTLPPESVDVIAEPAELIPHGPRNTSCCFR